MRRMWQEILTDLTLPIVVGLVLALASGRREDKRQMAAITTPTYDSITRQLLATQQALDAQRDKVSELRDKRDELSHELGDWRDWGRDLVENWAEIRRHTAPPHMPDRSTE